MYATRDDIVKRFGEKEVISLTDRDFTGQIDDVVLEGALVDACAEIDSYLGGRYQVPLAEPPKFLTGMACDIARYRLCGGDTQETELILKRYNNAINYLEKAARGIVTLATLPEGGTAPVDNTVQFQNGTRVFARDAGGY